MARAVRRTGQPEKGTLSCLAPVLATILSGKTALRGQIVAVGRKIEQLLDDDTKNTNTYLLPPRAKLLTGKNLAYINASLGDPW